MSCGEIVDVLLLDSGRPAWSNEHQSHLNHCESCRRLAAFSAAASAEAAPVPYATLRGIESALAADLRPVRAIAPRQHFVALFLAIFVFVAGLGVLSLGSRGFAVMTPIQTSVMLGALFSGAARLAWSLASLMSPGDLPKFPPASQPLAVTVTLAIVTAVLFQFAYESDFWIRSWRCVRLGAPISVLAAIPIWLVLRRGAVLSAPTIGLTAGLLAGLAGALALQIHCPNLEAAHILVSHLGVAALAAVLGWMLGLFIEEAATVFRRSN